MERRHVVFVGAYGIQNAGDDAPLLFMTDGLRRMHPEVDFTFTVFSRHPDPLLEQASGARLLPNVEYESRAAAGGKWFRGFNVGDDRTDLDAIETTIRDADLVVAGAGNVLVDICLDLFRGPIALLATYAFLADLHRTPFLLFGITAGPLQADRARTLSSWIARRASGVIVRDEASRALLNEIDAELVVDVLPDPVLGLTPASDEAFQRALAEEGIPRRGDRARLAVALRDLGFLGFDGGILVEALRRLSADYELLFVPQCTDVDCDDRAVAEAIHAQLGAGTCYHVRRRHSPDVLMRFYEGADVTLAARLHGAAFSAMAGVPVVGLAYLPKVRSFLETMRLESLCVDLADATPGSLVAAVERARSLEGEPIRRRSFELAQGVSAYLREASRLLDLSTTVASVA